MPCGQPHCLGEGPSPKQKQDACKFATDYFVLTALFFIHNFCKIINEWCVFFLKAANQGRLNNERNIHEFKCSYWVTTSSAGP